MIIYANDFGIVPGSSAAKNLTALFRKAAELDDNKKVVFEKGNYYIDASECESEMLYITNTVGDKEFSSKETPHKNRAAISIKNVSNLKIEGNGAKFIINGKATNAVIQNCKNLEIDDIEFSSVNPDMHELRVIDKSAFYVDFEIDAESEYEIRHSRLYFKGIDYCYDAFKKYRAAWHIGLVNKKTPDKIERVHHLFLNAIACRELASHKIRIYYFTTLPFNLGDRFYAYDVRRQYAGIFVDKSKNVAFKNIKQRFNYSLALVAQDTENIIIDRAEFAPGKKSGRLMASAADFIQICMCKGKVSVTNCCFEGAGDDCLNVHGMHYKIKRVKGNTITVSYMHPQSHGYNPLHSGDEIAFVNPKTLLENGRARVKASTLITEYDIELVLDDASAARAGDVIEDITMCPDVYFGGNTVNRIITRGLLLTTRGRVVVENNHFVSTTMSGILLSDDAESWYESGPCKDITIKSNVFDYCGQTPVLIKPENSIHKSAVHENIQIIGNVFKKYNGDCIKMKSSKNITVSGNRTAAPMKYTEKNCENVIVSENA